MVLRRLQREFVYATSAQAGGLSIGWDHFIDMPATERVSLMGEVEHLIDQINEAIDEASAPREARHGTVQAADD